MRNHYATNVSGTQAAPAGVKVKSAIKSGGLTSINHNAAPVRVGIKVKSAIKSGGLTSINHNAAPVRVLSALHRS